jgi:hypothetical protein
MIDRFPTPDEESRERGIASPVESTKIAVVIYWALFVLGGYALLQGTRNMTIIGITTLFAICLFMVTALFFSFAVLGTMKRRKISGNVPAVILSPVPQAAAQEQYKPVARVRRPAAGSFMIDALLKRD